MKIATRYVLRWRSLVIVCRFCFGEFCFACVHFLCLCTCLFVCQLRFYLYDYGFRCQHALYLNVYTWQNAVACDTKSQPCTTQCPESGSNITIHMQVRITNLITCISNLEHAQYILPPHRRPVWFISMAKTSTFAVLGALSGSGQILHQLSLASIEQSFFCIFTLLCVQWIVCGFPTNCHWFSLSLYWNSTVDHVVFMCKIGQIHVLSCSYGWCVIYLWCITTILSKLHPKFIFQIYFR